MKTLCNGLGRQGKTWGILIGLMICLSSCDQPRRNYMGDGHVISKGSKFVEIELGKLKESEPTVFTIKKLPSVGKRVWFMLRIPRDQFPTTRSMHNILSLKVYQHFGSLLEISKPLAQWEASSHSENDYVDLLFLGLETGSYIPMPHPMDMPLKVEVSIENNQKNAGHPLIHGTMILRVGDL